MSDYDYGYKRCSHRHSPVRVQEWRRTVEHLDHVEDHGAGILHRTRSFGNRPVPQINIYNELVQDANIPNLIPNPHGHEQITNERLAREVALLARENEHLALQADDWNDKRIAPGLGRYRDNTDRRQKHSPAVMWGRELENETERVRIEMELERMRDEMKKKNEDAKAREEKERITDEYEINKRDRDERRKSDEDRIRQKLELDERKAKEKEERDWKE